MGKVILAIVMIMQVARPIPSTNQHGKETPDAQQTQKQESAKSNPAPNAIISKGIIDGLPTEVNRQNQENKPTDDPHKWLDRLNGLFTAIIALFAVVTGIAVIGQFITARRTERAWMVTFEPQMLFDGRTTNAIYRCKITNVGRTPSRILETGIGLGRTTDLSQLPTAPPYSERIQFNRIVVAPNDFLPIGIVLSPPLSNEDWQAIRGGKLFLYACGFVRYFDVFGSRKRHIKETRFCHCSDIRLSLSYANEIPVRPCKEAPAEYHKAT
jgi:hypothetical protein